MNVRSLLISQTGTKAMLWLNVYHTDGTTKSVTIADDSLPSVEIENSKSVAKISVSTEPANKFMSAFADEINRRQ